MAYKANHFRHFITRQRDYGVDGERVMRIELCEHHAVPGFPNEAYAQYDMPLHEWESFILEEARKIMNDWQPPPKRGSNGKFIGAKEDAGGSDE